MIATPSYSIPKGVNSGVFGIVTGKYCDELEAVIQYAKSKGYRLPTNYQLTVISQLIGDLKDARIWQRYDLLYVLGLGNLNTMEVTTNDNLVTIFGQDKPGVRDFTLINLKNPFLYEGTRIPGVDNRIPIWSYNGMRSPNNSGNGGAINTNYIYGENYKQNDAGFSFYCTKDISGTANNTVIGRADSTNNRRDVLGFGFASQNLSGAINRTNGGNNYSATPVNTEGFHRLERTASNLTTYYRNALSIGTSTQASQTLTSDQPFYLGAINSTGTRSFAFPRIMTYFAIGSSLGSNLIRTETEIFKNYMVKVNIWQE